MLVKVKNRLKVYFNVSSSPVPYYRIYLLFPLNVLSHRKPDEPGTLFLNTRTSTRLPTIGLVSWTGIITGEPRITITLLLVII